MLHINLAEGQELGETIYRQMRRSVLDGRLRSGDRLPSSRELADTLQVAGATVVTAYDRLVAEGFAETRQGAGSFVSAWAQTNDRSISEQPSRHPLRPREV